MTYIHHYTKMILFSTEDFKKFLNVVPKEVANITINYRNQLIYSEILLRELLNKVSKKRNIFDINILNVQQNIYHILMIILHDWKFIG